MQEQQRFVNFIIVSMMILWIWSIFISPRLFPPPVKPVVAKAVKKDAGDDTPDKPAAKPVGGKNDKPLKLPVFKHREDIAIGSNTFDSGYRLFVKFDSKGAVISSGNWEPPTLARAMAHRTTNRR